MLTLLLLLIPLLAALGTIVLKPGQVKAYALVASLAQLAATVYMLTLFKNDDANQFLVDQWWVKSLGISFKAGIDGISMMLVLLTNVLVPLIILSAPDREVARPAAFFGLILLMQAALVGVFTALDGFLFYIFWELALIPIYFICMMWGGEQRMRITLKFFIYTLSGSLLMLVGLIYLYLQTPGTHSFDIDALYNVSLTPEAQGWLFWAFFIAFAIKIPVFPFHTWQPDTYTDAPAQGTMMLSGIMLKMGLYGMIRWMLPILPAGFSEWGHTALLLCVISIVYASCMALVQKDFKRLIAYSSVAHVGLIAAGIITLNLQGLSGAMIQMLSHGVNVVAMFTIVDIIQRRMKTRQLDELGGLAHNAPTFTILFLCVLLGSVSLPLTNGFVGELMLLLGVYQYSAWMAGFAGLTVILSAVYMLRAYQRIMLGEQNARFTEFTGLHVNEKIVLMTAVAIIFFTGIYPKPLLQMAQPALEEILGHVKDIY